MDPRALCDDFRAALLALNDNNMKRWKKFTGDFPMTYDKFCQRVEDIHFSKNPSEKSILWNAFQPEGRELTFREFVTFVQDDAPSAGQHQQMIDTSDPNVLIASFSRARHQLLDVFLSCDTAYTGFISQRAFTEISLQCGIVGNERELQRMTISLDPGNTGRINYFKLMYDISLFADSGPMSSHSTRPKKILDPSIFNSRQDSPQHGGGRKPLDPTVFGEKESGIPKPPTGHARRALDPSIFGEKECEKKEAPHDRNARTNLDPSIFGEKPQYTAVEAAPLANLDLSKTKDCTEYSEDETISMIARVANAKFRSIRDCFGVWRGASDRLTADAIFVGMAEAANAELSRARIEDLVEAFGGPLTVSSFTRLVSEGARINAPEPVKAAPPPLTETDILLNRIAGELKGKPWEPQIKASKNALDLSRNLKKLGVQVKSEDVRGVFEEYGMKKICAELKERQKPPKKRRN